MNERKTLSRWSRWRLALLAILGTAAFHVVLMLPLGFVLALNALWFNVTYAYWLAGAAFLFFWWTYQPTWTVPGRVVPRSEAPALYAELDAMSDAFDAPRIHEVRLNDEFNAGALEAKPRGLPWGRRRVMLLGVPLLALCDTTAVRAVMAHELGHFSRRHGRLGHWVYRARIGWMSFAAESASDDDTIIDRAAVRFAQWFGPWFSRISFAHSRQCEYEADATAAGMVGAQDMAAALLGIHVAGARLDRFARAEVPLLQKRLAHPPRDILVRWRDAVVHSAATEDELAAAAQQAPDDSDTHPCLSERLGALGVPMSDASRHLASATSAGASWWIDWNAVAQAHDAAWAASEGDAWHREHVRAAAFQDELQALRQRDERSVQRAWLEWESGDREVATGIAIAMSDQEPHASYLAAQSALQSADVSAMTRLEECIRRDPAWALPARRLMARHSGLMADDIARSRNMTLLEKARQRRANAMRALWHAVDDAKVQPLVLRPAALQVARACLARQTPLLAAWTLHLPQLVIADRAYPNVAVALSIDPSAMADAGSDEDALADMARALLERIVPPHWVVVVWTSFTTEALAPSVQAMLASCSAQAPDCVVLQRPVGEAAARLTTSPT